MRAKNDRKRMKKLVSPITYYFAFLDIEWDVDPSDLHFKNVCFGHILPLVMFLGECCKILIWKFTKCMIFFY